MRIAVYALGGGMGHMTRAISFARAATEAGHRVCVLCNSSFAPFVTPHATAWLTEASFRIDVLDHRLNAEACRSEVLRWLDECDFDALLVDTFPRGIGGELARYLPTLALPAFLVHRDLNPEYVSSRQLDVFAKHYEAIFCPGESGVLANGVAGNGRKAIDTPPWLVLDSEQTLGSSGSRRILESAADDQPVIAVLGCGRDEEILEMGRIADRLTEQCLGRAHVRFCCLTTDATTARTIRTWPLLRVHAGIDLVVGAGGYNTFYETQASGTPLIAVGRKRMYDRQVHRLSDTQKTTLEEIVPKVESWLGQWPGSQLRTLPQFSSGASSALRHIEAFVR